MVRNHTMARLPVPRTGQRHRAVRAGVAVSVIAMEAMSPLHLEDWRAWSAAEMSCKGDGRYDVAAGDSKGSLPPMLRRRLDQAGRSTCDILRALDPEGICPLIHASRHGDAAHTLQMLQSLAAGTPLSPARFAVSVHNAVLGVHSIAWQHRGPLQALGACGHEFDALIFEAHGYLEEGHDAVVVAFSEGIIPADYDGYAERPPAPCAVGMRLTRDRGLKLLTSDSAKPGRPTPLDVIAWLSSARPHLDGQHRWQLEVE
jgi:hypothetical protein